MRSLGDILSGSIENTCTSCRVQLDGNGLALASGQGDSSGVHDNVGWCDLCVDFGFSESSFACLW